jgi:hypothetical protein
MKHIKTQKQLNESEENLNSGTLDKSSSISDVRSSKIIISLLDSEPIDNKSKDGYVNVGKWTKKEGGTFSIWESRKPIFEILNSEELYYLMKRNRIEIEKDIFNDSFFDNVLQNISIHGAFYSK